MDIAEWGPYLFALAAALAGWFLHKLYAARRENEHTLKLDRAHNEILTLTHELNRHRDASKETITRLEAASMNLRLSNDELKEEVTKLNEQLSSSPPGHSEIQVAEIESIAPKENRFEPFDQREDSVKTSILASSSPNDQSHSTKKQIKKQRRKKLKAKLNKAKNKILDLETSLSKIKPKKINFVDLDTPKKKKKSSRHQ